MLSHSALLSKFCEKLENEVLVGKVHGMKFSMEKDSEFCIMIHKENVIKRDSKLKR